jgi:hypothetical protein
MSDDFIDYGKLIDDAMHVIVRYTLEKIAREGLPGKHHFFISFLTQFPGVLVSEKLRSRYANEMTIVLQYQFEDLKVTAEDFSVILSFDGEKECVVVPFAALTAFADPSVRFGLQFRHLDTDEEDADDDSDELLVPAKSAPVAKSDGLLDVAKTGKKTAGSSEAESKNSRSKMKTSAVETSSSNVIKLDSFRSGKSGKKKT